MVEKGECLNSWTALYSYMYMTYIDIQLHTILAIE